MNRKKTLLVFAAMLTVFFVDINFMKAEDVSVKSKKIFIINNDGTVTDARNSLMWIQKPLTDEYEWMDAVNHVRSLNKANGGKGTCGYKDWRLPKIDELKQLVKDSGGNAAEWLNINGFENIKPGGYWSSTTFNADTPSAWSIDLSNGKDYGCSMSMKYMALPVRKIRK